MHTDIKVIYVFVSCPNDVEPEARIVEKVCKSLTKVIGMKRGVEIKTLYWRDNVVGLITGEGAQPVIDEQIEKYNYDIYVGILWKRFGDKQSNGLTPTEGEFERAFTRRQKTGRPEIKFYFKIKNFSPSTYYDGIQVAEVQKFRERIKDLGLYDEFNTDEEFQRKIYESILYIVENFDSLTSKKVLISKHKYPKIENYLQRKVCEIKHYIQSELLFLKDSSAEDIIKFIPKDKRIVLLADAGVGKTTELQRIAWHFSDDNSPFYPFLIYLNKYVNQNISQILDKNWQRIPENKLLIILDGLDEIESKNKNDAIRQIELFSEQNPNCHILVSCRMNFYKSKTGQSSGTLHNFKSFILIDLDEGEIKKYVKEKLG